MGSPSGSYDRPPCRPRFSQHVDEPLVIRSFANAVEDAFGRLDERPGEVPHVLIPKSRLGCVHEERDWSQLCLPLPQQAGRVQGDVRRELGRKRDLYEGSSPIASSGTSRSMSGTATSQARTAVVGSPRGPGRSRSKRPRRSARRPGPPRSRRRQVDQEAAWSFAGNVATIPVVTAGIGARSTGRNHHDQQAHHQAGHRAGDEGLAEADEVRAIIDAAVPLSRLAGRTPGQTIYTVLYGESKKADGLVVQTGRGEFKLNPKRRKAQAPSV